MYQRVKAYVEEQHMLEKKDRVIVGVSGGADSVCLLFVLTKLRDERQKNGDGTLEITAVHVHHGLRGDSADADERYVRKICDAWNVPLVVYHKNIRELAKCWNMSEEEAGRKARREAFLEVRNQYSDVPCDNAQYGDIQSHHAECANGRQESAQGFGKIALAHHRNDEAETVLFHLCRGTDVRGLGGIAPVSGFWIRPLLNIGRNEIESYLEKVGISYCTDETNAENVYARNKLRNQVIPQLEEINEQAVWHISRTAQSVRELWSYVDMQIEEYKKKVLQIKPQSCRKETNLATGAISLILNKNEYDKVPVPLKSYVIHRIICEAAGHEKDISAVHVQAVEELLNRQVGRKIDLPYAVAASRIYGGVKFEKKPVISTKMIDPNHLNDENIENPESLFQFRIFERPPGMKAFPEKTYTKWFDYDIINNTVEIRHRQAGDVLAINKNGGTQRLKKYFINEKISQEEREKVWLVADGHDIMWVVGHRQSQRYQITESTKKILEIHFCKGENYGRDSKSIS